MQQFYNIGFQSVHKVQQFYNIVFPGWIVFNVSGALRQWQHEQATNQGLMLEVTEVGLDEQVHPVVLGIVTGKQTTFDKEVKRSIPVLKSKQPVTLFYIDKGVKSYCQCN
jgi:hypothetical protein